MTFIKASLILKASGLGSVMGALCFYLLRVGAGVIKSIWVHTKVLKVPKWFNRF